MGKVNLWVGVSIVALVVGAIAIYKAYGSNINEFTQITSAYATFVLAFLTAAYVFTTNRQLSIMQQQLSEMEKGRELANQPLPLINIAEVYLENPRVFYSPPDEEMSIQSRAFIKYKVKNIGTGVALGVDVISCISANIDDEECEYYITSPRIEYIEQNGEHDKIIRSLLLDNGHEFLEILVQGGPKNHLVLSLNIPYQNFLGVLFKVECKYRIFSNENDRQKIKEWLKLIIASKIEYKDVMKEIVTNMRKNREKGRQMFKEVQEHFNNNVPDVAKQQINLNSSLIRSSFKVSVITQEEFESLTKGKQSKDKQFRKKEEKRAL